MAGLDDHGDDAPLTTAADWLALDRDRAGFAQSLDAGIAAGGPPVTVAASSFASAAARCDGTIVVRGPRFANWCAESAPLLLHLPDATERSRVSLLHTRPHPGGAGRPVAVAAGRLATARAWPLAPAVAAALTSGEAAFGLLAFCPDPARWRSVGLVFGLTAAQAKLARALTESGDLRTAAAQCGIAYETARKLLAAAMRRTNTTGQAELIGLMLRANVGEAIADRPPVELLRELFGGTARQARLATLIAQGLSRDEAAAALGISVHRVKTDLTAVFQHYGVESASALARVVGEVGALNGLAQACEVSVGAGAGSAERLRFVPRRWAPGRIAVVDHGPHDGRPVLILHSTMMGRHHPPAFIAALQARGGRPIAFDRAGFGLTDRAPEAPVENGVRDAGEVIDALDLGRPLVVARCCTAAVIATHLSHAGRVAGGVMLWPEGPRKPDHRGRGIVDRGRAMFTRHADLARRFVGFVAAHASDRALTALWRHASAGYPNDRALLEDAGARRDILRATRQAVTGLHGLLDEALELGLAPQPVRTDGRDWTLVYGDIEEDGDLSAAIAWWRAHLPGAAVVTLPGGGNFLHMTHPGAIADALAAIAQPRAAAA